MALELNFVSARTNKRHTHEKRGRTPACPHGLSFFFPLPFSLLFSLFSLFSARFIMSCCNSRTKRCERESFWFCGKIRCEINLQPVCQRYILIIFCQVHSYHRRAVVKHECTKGIYFRIVSFGCRRRLPEMTSKACSRTNIRTL